MQITLKGGGAIVGFLPGEFTGTTTQMTLTDGASVACVIDELGIPDDQPLMVILNGDLVHAEERRDATLNDGDRLSLLPPIQAG